VNYSWQLKKEKLVQGIIDKQEEMSFKIRGWAIALFAGLTFTFFRQTGESFSEIAYVTVIIALSWLFFVIERRHMEAFFKLVEHASEVEERLEVHDYKFGVQKKLREGKVSCSSASLGNTRFKEIRLVYVALPTIAITISSAYQTILENLIACN